MTHVPLIVALRNPGLKDRHWDKLSAAVGAPLQADSSFSLARALQLGLDEKGVHFVLESL